VCIESVSSIVREVIVSDTLQGSFFIVIIAVAVVAVVIANIDCIYRSYISTVQAVGI
jgi:hypothetical protein